MKRILNVVLTHLGADRINAMLTWWRRYAPDAEILLAVTSRGTELSALNHPHKVLVDDPRLHTREHQREFQSYTPVFVAASRWLAGKAFDYVHLLEYDHLPLREDFNLRQLDRLEAERADMLCCHLGRVDDTNSPHYLYHKNDARFHPYWESISVRKNRRVVLSTLGTGTFWTRQAFEAVAAQPEPFRMYLELWIPTVAHHLGYRVRSFSGMEASGFVRPNPAKSLLTEAKAHRAWTVHPIKVLPAET